MIATATDTRLQTMTIDGERVSFTPGETIYQVAGRHNRQIPTLCFDPRLEAFGGCRLCVVEVEGSRLPVASCTTKATAGMAVRTATPALEKHRRTLLEMVASENREIDVSPLRGYASQELLMLIERYGAQTGRFQGRHSGTTHPSDDNPFILRDYDLCISCYRCVRVCAEQEGDHAISVMGRGFHTQITTEFNGSLRDSSCTFCGQCVQTCPTGALADRKALRYAAEPGEIGKVRTVCGYCGVGCALDIVTKNRRIVGIQPAMDGPANMGALCIKGQFAADYVHHGDRLRMPLVRGPDGEFHETDWDTALGAAAEGFRLAEQRYGRQAIYAVASGRAPNEAAYVMQKIMRAGWGLNQIDNCSRA